MKKIILLTAAACALAVGANTAVLSKDRAEQTRDVASFSAVKLKGSMDVDVKVGPAQSVRVVADADYIDNLLTKVEDGVLSVELERGNYHNVGIMKVFVTVPSLTSAGLLGSGDLTVAGVKSDKFDLILKGSGDASLADAEVGDLTLELSGSGDLRAKGTCSTVEIELVGSGDLTASHMECKDADVTLRGSGDLSAFASDGAKVTLTGSGDIDIYGSPKTVKSKVRGSGDLSIK